MGDMPNSVTPNSGSDADNAGDGKPTPEAGGASDTDNADQNSDDQATDGDTDKGKPDGDDNSDDGGGHEYTAEDFKMPDGMEMDTALFDSVLPIAKELGINKDGMGKLVDVVVESKVAAQEAQVADWEETRTGWKAEVNADKELGGKNLEQTSSNVDAAMNEYGSKELKEFAEHYGWADNPHYVRMMNNVGKLLREGQAGSGGNPKGKTENVADRWYGNKSDDNK